MSSLNDYSLFTLDRDAHFLMLFIMLLIYVNDVILTITSSQLISNINSFIHSHFYIKDLGLLHYFLGIDVSISATGLFLNQ